MSLLIPGLAVSAEASASVPEMPDASASAPEMPDAAEQTLGRDALLHLGQVAAAEIADGDSLFIGAGTAAESVARALATHRRLLVVTNSLGVAVILGKRPLIEVVLVGGSVRACDGATVDHFSVEMIGKFKVDCAIIGIPALQEDGVLLGHEPEEIDLYRAIVANARRVMLVIERSTLKRSPPIRVGHLSEIDTVVIDALRSDSLRDICRLHRVRVIEAGAITPSRQP